MATRTQARLALAKRNQTAMKQVSTLLTAEATKVLSVAPGTQQELGGYLRTVVPGLVDKYGNVNAEIARQYYDEQRALYLASQGLQPGSANRVARNSARARASRLANAKTAGQIYVAKIPTFSATKLTESMIGYSMSRFMKDLPYSEDLVNAMTRAIGSYHRDTVLYNAGLDEAVIGVQRVAEPNACAFCMTVALGSYRSYTTNSADVRVGSYAADYHNNCNCSIETLYEGDAPIRPDYYDQFEKDYVEATAEAGTTNAKAVFGQIRENTDRR